MWTFYTNRGQCITSFGVLDKDGAMLEFQPANKAYRLVSLQGFRTFIKVDGKFYEPFSERSKLKNEMQISPDSLRITEENRALKLKSIVTYFTLPGESFPALVRTVEISNLSPKRRKIEIIDGLTTLIPYGFGNDLLKNICRTIEAWCLVENLDRQAPFYRLKVIPADVTETKRLEAGHFYLPFCHPSAPLQVIVDPRIVFGENSSLEVPENFISKKFKVSPHQITCGFLPSAFAYTKTTLKGKADFKLYSIIGKAENIGQLNRDKKKLTLPEYITEKFTENRQLIQSIGGLAATKTSSDNFDAYCFMTFLDNVMRGGLPVNINGKTQYLYYRKHGDMERDYNNFKLMPTPFSHGSGNYRDINQNRRNDLFFNPDVGDANIVRFFNLIQLDGFNPLVVFEDSACHGEGFWTDHFSYNADLLESYENIYPDRIQDLLFGQKIFTFYQNNHFVVPRREKYCLRGGKVRQFGSVRCDETIKESSGTYQTTLIVKILSLVANKAASFDAAGVGIEMEADKPDWYDALNGLPGLLGSSLSETLELKRLCVWTVEHLKTTSALVLPIEVKEYVDGLSTVLSSSHDSFTYWDTATAIKENYRQLTRHGISGKEAELSLQAARQFLELVIKKCTAAAEKCLREYKNYYTYFINEVVDYTENDDKSISVKKIKQVPLPLFLEGFVHALKVEKDKNIPALVKKSPLYDQKLKMYKVNASLKTAPVEIGRAKVFTPGWLENESIWLHMEYKYMLELLKAGLYADFFGNLKHVLVPFMDAKRYGRSLLENSSFIVSSAHPDTSLHGRGFVARLSGSTAEFVDMWIIMMTGKEIFSLDAQDKLCFQLSPILPTWLFKNRELSFKLLGSIDVTYLNAANKNTWEGLSVASYILTLPGGKEVEITGPAIPEPYARLIRERQVTKIVATLS
ncbi:MAG: hypothetical protein WCT39_04900 [Candidatus Margulisiibacteriota bacterium]